MNKTTISSRRWLHLPFEIKARELHAKVLLSCVAAERGWGVIIGHAAPMIRKYEILPPGMIIRMNSARTMELIKKTQAWGHRMSCFDEEGLLYINRECYNSRLDINTFDAVDYIFAWGNHQAHDICLLLNRPQDKIILSGNPRVDLLRHDLRVIFSKNVPSIQKKYGRIILVNTSLGLFSHVTVKNYVDHMKYGKKVFKTAEEEFWMRRIYDYQKMLFPHFLHLIPILSQKFPNHTIIIRPHPSESHVPWIKLAQELENVKVVYEGSANEWIMAADAMIQNNCMTSVEAFLLGKPSIYYRPNIDEAVQHPLPIQVSYQAFSENELLEILNKIINNVGNFQLEREKQFAYASEYISNIEGKLACDKIMDTLDTVDLPKSEATFPFNPTFNDYKLLIMKVIKPDIYLQQQLTGLTLEELQGILKEFQQATGRFANVKIVKIDTAGGLQNSCYCFYEP